MENLLYLLKQPFPIFQPLFFYLPVKPRASHFLSRIKREYSISRLANIALSHSRVSDDGNVTLADFYGQVKRETREISPDSQHPLQIRARDSLTRVSLSFVAELAYTRCI